MNPKQKNTSINMDPELSEAWEFPLLPTQRQHSEQTAAKGRPQAGIHLRISTSPAQPSARSKGTDLT